MGDCVVRGCLLAAGVDGDASLAASRCLFLANRAAAVWIGPAAARASVRCPPPQSAAPYRLSAPGLPPLPPAPLSGPGAAGRWGAPPDMAGVAAFLSTPASDFVTGTAIPVDGGFSIAM